FYCKIQPIVLLKNANEDSSVARAGSIVGMFSLFTKLTDFSLLALSCSVLGEFSFPLDVQAAKKIIMKPIDNNMNKRFNLIAAPLCSIIPIHIVGFNCYYNAIIFFSKEMKNSF
ncbi:hypothetical protein ABET36_12075, partial [Caldifermentibacillus hisashii]|uniref:hypothetical protein n=1 Tax=Caldifermentibacillus hisashii TaxID=996558 RepID=UPI003D1D06B5